MPARHARGRAARIGPALDTILANHAYPPAIEQLLAEALVLTALLGALLKDPSGQLTIQAQTEGGIVDLLVCDYHGGELRGYVRHDRRAAGRGRAEPDALRAVRQGLSGDHLRPAGDRRALPGHRPAGGRGPGARRRKAISPSPSRSRASSASRRARTSRAGSPAACCSSICPKARRAATGCTPGSTIPNGRMSRCWPGR